MPASVPVSASASGGQRRCCRRRMTGLTSTRWSALSPGAYRRHGKPCCRAPSHRGPTSSLRRCGETHPSRPRGPRGHLFSRRLSHAWAWRAPDTSKAADTASGTQGGTGTNAGTGIGTDADPCTDAGADTGSSKTYPQGRRARPRGCASLVRDEPGGSSFWLGSRARLSSSTCASPIWSRSASRRLACKSLGAEEPLTGLLDPERADSCTNGSGRCLASGSTPARLSRLRRPASGTSRAGFGSCVDFVGDDKGPLKLR